MRPRREVPGNVPAVGADLAIYDSIGTTYARHRRSDPRVAAQLHAALGGARRVVNVGAGTGSYEPADAALVAVEPSDVMVAQRAPGTAPVVQAVGEHLPFADGAFDAAMAVITIHHWTDWRHGLAELCRVAPRVAVLTFDPAPHFSLWLFEEYVPEVLDLPASGVPPISEVAEALGTRRVETVPVPADCVDGFNWAFWRRPEAYLDPGIRACTSALAQLPQDLVASRMERLRRDLDDGTWRRRHADLLELDSIDGGFRLVVREGP
jgi:SAM-dependent methyltransferase